MTDLTSAGAEPPAIELNGEQQPPVIMRVPMGAAGPKGVEERLRALEGEIRRFRPRLASHRSMAEFAALRQVDARQQGRHGNSIDSLGQAFGPTFRTKLWTWTLYRMGRFSGRVWKLIYNEIFKFQITSRASFGRDFLAKNPIVLPSRRVQMNATAATPRVDLSLIYFPIRPPPTTLRI